MFQFPGLALLINQERIGFTNTGCPIRISTDQFVCADPRGFSQLITSFFASESLGILRTPFSTSFNYSHVDITLRSLTLLILHHVNELYS